VQLTEVLVRVLVHSMCGAEWLRQELRYSCVSPLYFLTLISCSGLLRRRMSLGSARSHLLFSWCLSCSSSMARNTLAYRQGTKGSKYCRFLADSAGSLGDLALPRSLSRLVFSPLSRRRRNRLEQRIHSTGSIAKVPRARHRMAVGLSQQGQRKWWWWECA